MNASCPKCEKPNFIPLCRNCGKSSLSVEKILGNYFLTCRKCDKSYSYIPCSGCGCDIPARAFANPSVWALLFIVFVVIVVIQWLVG